MSGRTPPPTDGREPAAPAPGSLPARKFGAPRRGAVPLVESVRITGPDLAGRAQAERTRGRLVITAAAFAILFGAVIAKLADATVFQPMQPPPQKFVARPSEDPDDQPTGPTTQRAMITDRNGEILAVSLPVAGLYANPKEMMDTAIAAHQLKLAVPRLDEEKMRARLASAKQFVYLARRLSPKEELAVNGLGIPGISFQSGERRQYPQGRAAAQVLGGVDVDEHGVAGVERAFDERLRKDQTPLRLSIDVRVQAVVRDELLKAMTEFQAIGACGIVMDVRTGEVVAMVSLPDYDANQFGSTPPDDRFNRAITAMYEPGSTFKLQTAAMALDAGVAQIWNQYDASHDIKIGRFTISDFEGKHRWLYLPEVLAYSSNLGAAHIAQSVGATRQRAWLDAMGMMSRIGIELPEAGRPLFPPVSNWGEVATMTIGFGHGVAVSPLHVVRGTATLANGGVLMRPTILAPIAGDPPREGTRVMQTATSDVVRKLMRLVVTEGYGKPADVPGYYVGGKTGTAEKVGAHGYKKHTNVSAFISVFPMNAPRYAVYMMLDEPHGNASTGGYSTAGAVSAPAAGRVIGRIAPMLGLLPDLANAARIQQSLFIPLEPGHGTPLHAPPAPAAPMANAPASNQPASAQSTSGQPNSGQPGPAMPAAAATPAAPRTVPRDFRHEASLRSAEPDLLANAQAARFAAHQNAVP